jgi:hypothetical protein
MIHLTDENPAPADLVLALQANAAAAVIDLTLRPTESESGFPAEPTYRRIDAADLDALAAAESVQIAREGRQRLRLSIPWAPSRAA